MDTDKTLVIFCTSKMIIHQLCYSAAKKMSLGWPGPNGDIFRDTVLLLAKRHAQTTFVHIESKAKNGLKKEAYSLAKSALEAPESATIFEPTADQAATCARAHPVGISNKRKVATDLEESSPENPGRIGKMILSPTRMRAIEDAQRCMSYSLAFERNY
jgi:hypothetical protein